MSTATLEPQARTRYPTMLDRGAPPVPQELRAQLPSRERAQRANSDKSVRIDFIISMIERKLREEQMWLAYSQRFGLARAAFRTDHIAAYDVLNNNLKKGRTVLQAEALAMLEAQIRDSRTPPAVKVKAQGLINKMLGLDDDAASGNERVMPVIEVIVHDHKQAVEFNSIRDQLTNKLVDSGKLIESTAMKVTEKLIESTPNTSLVDWD